MVACLAAGAGVPVCHAVPPADPFPGVAGAYVVAIDGQVLWEHDATRRLPPASLTKMMTVLLAVDGGRLDETVTVTAAAAVETGSRLGLKTGDRLRVGDLVAASLMASANDACRALAEHLGPGETAFVRSMNAMARTLGMKDTQFVNASGHDAPGHRSTARDMALLADAVMARPFLAALARTVELPIATRDGARRFTLVSKNEMLGRYVGTIGVKTGFTRGAGTCLAAVVERGGRRASLVMLNGRNRWWDAEKLFDAAFETPPGPR